MKHSFKLAKVDGKCLMRTMATAVTYTSHYDWIGKVCAEKAVGTPSPVALADVLERPLLLPQVDQPCPMV